MEQIKHKLGDLVYVISDPDGNEERFVITYGIVVSISHIMDKSDYDRFPTEDKEKYEGDYLNYGVLTSSQEVLEVFYCDVFPTVQDALVETSKRLEWSKTAFEHTFKLKNTNENL
jgi:hypothetical protein